MKKILAMVLSVAIIASLAIGGTVAYFTDSDAATNVFTVGNVKIKLLEQQRDRNNLEDFEQNKSLMPIVAKEFEYDDFGMNTAQNYQDKIVRVKNTGKSDAWVRIFVAVPAALDDRNEAGEVTEKTALHWDTGESFTENSTDGNNYTTEFGEAKFINKQTFANVEYNIYCFTRKTPLEPEHITAAAFVGFYLDENVDNNSDDGYYYIGSKKDEANRITVKGVGEKDGNGEYYAPFDVSKGVLIPVCAEAVQAAGFATPAEAFRSAIEGNISPYDPWSAGNAVIKLPGAAQTAAEFKKELSGLKGATGEYTITLNPNMVYDMSGNTAAIACIQPDAEIIIEGNGAVITGLKVPLIQGVNAKKITIRDLTIGDADITVSSPVNGVGAFIQYTNSSRAHDVTFSNCHLKNSKINSSANGDNDRIGGLIGFASLPEDGSITIENCSVEKCELNGISMVSGLVGELVQGKMTVTNSAVNDCKITSNGTGKWRIGTVFGRQKKATTTITGFTRSGNTLTQANASDVVSPEDQEKDYRYIYGEKDTSASLTVEGTTVY